jgi:Cupin-like domain
MCFILCNPKDIAKYINMNSLLTAEIDDVDEMHQFFDRYSSFIPGMKTPVAVPVLRADTLEQSVFEKEWVAKNKACLIKGAVRHWPAVKKWRDKNYWLTKCENIEVSIYPHQNFINGERQNSGRETMSFHAAVERLYQNRDHIFSMPSAQIQEGSGFAGVISDLPGFTFLPTSKLPRYYYRMRFFMYRRAATNWHYHGVDESLMCQVNGTKRVALLSPNIPRPKYVKDFLKDECYLNEQPFDPSLDLRPMVVDVEEGDALYIPPYWHHIVVPTDGEIGFTVAFCWKSPTHILGNFSNFFVRDIYREVMKPFRPRTIKIAFRAAYAGVLYSLRRLTGRA